MQAVEGVIDSAQYKVTAITAHRRQQRAVRFKINELPRWLQLVTDVTLAGLTRVFSLAQTAPRTGCFFLQMSYRVLCVDDNPLVLSTLKLLLETNGYMVTAAATGRDALACAATDIFDAAVLDFELPDLRGDALAQLLKNMQPRLPLILFSGCTDIPEQNTGQFVTALPKGSSMNQLIETVARIIEANVGLVGLE